MGITDVILEADLMTCFGNDLLSWMSFLTGTIIQYCSRNEMQNKIAIWVFRVLIQNLQSKIDGTFTNAIQYPVTIAGVFPLE